MVERKQAERRQKLLLDELNHRVKNTLAIIQAIARQTLQTAESPDAFQRSFEGRLLALSQTHNLLAQAAWEGVSLRDMLQRELAPHTDGDRPRHVLRGEDIHLGPEAAVTMGMALYELAANATRYGALSVPTGEVRVTWEIDAHNSLSLDWQEVGGPPVHPPRRRGFGSRLIERGLVRQMGCEARLDFQTAGLCCFIRMPLDRASIRRGKLL